MTKTPLPKTKEEKEKFDKILTEPTRKLFKDLEIEAPDVKKKINLGGEEIKLSDSEYEEYRTGVLTEVAPILDFMVNDLPFKELSDAEKKKIISEQVGNIRKIKTDESKDKLSKPK